MVANKKKKLREGFTTGTCAAIASKAAVKMALGSEDILFESIVTPRGDTVKTDIYDIKKIDNFVSCAVKKNSGDDPDITDGIMIYAKVELNNSGIINILGGKGIGRVTKPGLSQKIGEAAINTVPGKMIEREVREAIEETDSNYGADVTIFAPEGEEIAQKTFNPRLGIVGGISILGTSGIVEPMSEKALIESIGVEMDVVKGEGVKNIILTPGNYGEDFIKNTLNIGLEGAVKCSNFIGEAIDMAVDRGFEGILLIGHIGKLVKLGAGIMNTHSHNADGRMEIFTAHAGLMGAPVNVLKSIMNCVTTDQAIKILIEYNLFESTMESIMDKIEFHLKQRCLNEIPVGAFLFSTANGVVGKTKNADELLSLIIQHNKL